jgi:hypothetical protein
MNLLKDLEESVPRLLGTGEIDTVLISTYTLSLRFFERLVLPRLRRLGAVRIGILVDRAGYEASLDDPLGQDECGRGYVVERAAGGVPLLHAKALWLHGDLDIAYVGSHNLTMSGYNDQLEVTSRLASSDPAHLTALRSLHRNLSRLVQHSSLLGGVWKGVPEPHPGEAEPTADFLSSLDRSLLVQLTETIQRAHGLSVVTPFLDADALQGLAENLGARRVELIVPHEGTDIPLSDAIARLPDMKVRRVDANHRLHAKAYFFATPRGRWLAVGSANCTNAGLTRSARNGGNVEFLVLLRDGELSAEGLPLEEVADPSEMRGTGRRWDEGRPERASLRVLGATYQHGMLGVEWEADGSAGSVATLRVDERVYQSQSSPIEIELGTPPFPPIITLEADLPQGYATARAWIVFPEELETQVAGRNARRWSEYLRSDDPLRYGEGVGEYLGFLMRELLRPEHSGGARVHVAPRPPDRSKADALEVFSFSNNPGEITSSVGRLVTGNMEIDPLAALRGLVARLHGRAPVDVEQDIKKINDYEERRARAKRSVGEYLVQHLNRLTASDLDWQQTQREAVSWCLRGTFEAIAVLWPRVVRDGPAVVRSRVGESIANLLFALAKEELTRMACAQLEVAGPLVFAVGSAAEAVEADDMERLRDSAKELLPSSPEAVVSEWKERYAERDELLESHRGERHQLHTLVTSAERLLGIADQFVRIRQERWQLLCDLARADELCDPSAVQLLERARVAYASEEVWSHYETGRAAGQSPPVCRVTEPVCARCHQLLPDIKKRRLEHGDAVTCWCGAILLFGS